MLHPLKIVRTWRNRLRLIERMRIRPDDLVLEVASGQNPNPRSNVLCERYVLDDTERNEEPVLIDRPFVVGDAYELPFRDQAFDYVICSPLLEHLDDPTTVIRELQRVAPRGYVETPSRVNEKLNSFPFHLWYVSSEEGTMVFREKPRPIHDEELRGWFQGLGAAMPGFYDFYFENLHELGNVVGIVWKGSLPHRVERLDKESSEPGFSEAEPPNTVDEVAAIETVLRHASRTSWRVRVNSAIGRAVRRRSQGRVRLEELLVCPKCRVGLETTTEALECRECGRVYPVVRNGDRQVPFLVAPG